MMTREEKNAYHRQWSNLNPDKCRRYEKEKKLPREQRMAIQIQRRAMRLNKRNSDEENTKRDLARNAVSKKIKRGTMTRLPCEKCGDPKSQAHHDDYDKRFEVRWLCSKHHGEAHRHYIPKAIEKLKLRPKYEKPYKYVWGKGHPVNEVNSYRNKHGERICRVCRNIREKQRRAKLRLLKQNKIQIIPI